MDLHTSISRAVPAPTAVAQVPMIGEFQFQRMHYFLYANVCFLLLEVNCLIGILQVVSDILFQDYTIVRDNYNDMDCSFRSDSLQF